MEAEQNGTRKDLAAFLRRHRRALKLRFFDVQGGRNQDHTPTHMFWSALPQPPFRGLRYTFDFTIFPF